MAYNIVKHLRGTTQEWKDHDIIPAEGELVIEECAGGFCRCKIGDGVRSFSTLRYVEDFAVQELLLKLIDLKSDLTKDFVDKLSASESAQSDHLAAVEQELINAIKSCEQMVTQAYILADEDLLKEAVEQTSDKLTVLRNEIMSNLRDIADGLDKKISDEASSSADALETTTEQLDKKIDNIESRLTTKVNDDISKLDVKFIESLANEITKVETQLEAITSELGETKESASVYVQEQIKELSEALTESEATVEASLQTAIKEQAAAVKTTTDAIKADIASLAQKLSTEKEILNTKIESTGSTISSSLTTAYTAAIESLQNAIKDDIDILETAQNNKLETAQNQLNTEIESAKETHKKDINRLEASLSTASTAIGNINAAVEQLKLENTSSNAELLKLQEAEARLDSNDAKLLDNICGVSNRLNDLSTSLSKRISDLDETYTSIQQAMTSFEDTQLATNVNIINTLNTFITNVYVELLDLVDDDVAIIEKVFYLQNSLLDKIDSLKANTEETLAAKQLELENITSSLLKNTSDISLLASTLDNIKTDLQEGINTLNKSLSEAISNSSADRELIHSELDSIKNDIEGIKAAGVNTDLSTEFADLKAFVQDEEVGLSRTYTIADTAYDLARSNVVEIHTINKNYIRFEDENICIDEDVIIFSCGNASETIIVGENS